MEVLMKKVVRIISSLFIIIPMSGLFIGICTAEVGEESILSRPIIEGKSIAGVNIGDHESNWQRSGHRSQKKWSRHRSVDALKLIGNMMPWPVWYCYRIWYLYSSTWIVSRKTFSFCSLTSIIATTYSYWVSGGAGNFSPKMFSRQSLRMNLTRW